MGIGLILATIFIGVPALVFGIAFISAVIDTNNEKREAEERANNEYKSLYNKILQSRYSDAKADIEGEVKELPQVTFERWLSFYNASPAHWDMNKFYTKASNIPDAYNYLLPTYYKTVYHPGVNKKPTSKTIGIPVFWSSPEEMRKFNEWVKNEYNSGNAAGYARKRDENLEQLASYLQDDIEERRQQIQKDYAKIVDEVEVANSNIKLVLQEGQK